MSETQKEKAAAMHEATDIGTKLTPQDRRVLAALAEHGSGRNGAVARSAGIYTMSPRETLARHCIKLTKMGLAVKEGTRMFPDWRISDAGSALLRSLQEKPHG